jgi:hypothetical protein
MSPYEHFYKHHKFFERMDKFNIKPWHWISLSVIVAGADFLSDATIQFPILYIIPIALAGWSSKRNYAIVMAIILPCLRFIFHMMWDAPWVVSDALINVLIRIVVFTILAYLISFTKELQILRGFLHVIGSRYRNISSITQKQCLVMEFARIVFQSSLINQLQQKYTRKGKIYHVK